jgi:hypothetical protein
MAQPENHHRWRVIRVAGGVATVCSRAVMLRAQLHIQDGFYLFNERNELVLQEPHHFQGFPDPLGCYQPFERMIPSEKVPPALVSNLIRYLELMRQRKVNVVVDKFGFIPMARHGAASASDKREHFGFGFELPLGNAELILDPHNLKLALVEMMRYDGCHIYHFNRVDVETPLVLGYNWESCALVAPIRS